MIRDSIHIYIILFTKGSQIDKFKLFFFFNLQRHTCLNLENERREKRSSSEITTTHFWVRFLVVLLLHICLHMSETPRNTPVVERVGFMTWCSQEEYITWGTVE